MTKFSEKAEMESCEPSDYVTFCVWCQFSQMEMPMLCCVVMTAAQTVKHKHGANLLPS